MPKYFYHLKFELYPRCDRSRVTKTVQRRKESSIRQPDEEDSWLPGKDSDIFDSRLWPRHRIPVAPIQKDARIDRGETRRTFYGFADRTPDHHFLSQAQPASAVIDCGTSRATHTFDEDAESLIQPISSNADIDFPPPSPSLLSGDFDAARRDWRFGSVRIESWDSRTACKDEDFEEETMAGRPIHRRGESSSAMNTLGVIGSGGQAGQGTGIDADLTNGAAGRVTKARFEEGKNTDVGWGIVHLYRDSEESSVRDIEVYNSTALSQIEDSGVGDGTGRDYTTLCIPAVPSYLTPSDFLGFVGERTRELVSHFRMVMTGRLNRYLVLMKFRDGEAAAKWKAEWDGKVFNSMEPETCHVMFIKSITFQTPSTSTLSTTTPANTSFPALAHDPFTSSSTHLKPFPPPTPSLIELPTCPVCLERMDDTTGLLTILCQHVFHCSCLEKWRGSGCPVCRHTNTSSLTSPSFEPPFGSSEASLCSVCDSSDDLWICLICGNVGCGRYKGGHAKEHWKDTSHCFALEIETQHVWDYAGDVWVHRLIRDKGNGKVVELPASSSTHHNDVDMVPREKLERIGIEYTHLLTSQLESQRVYFEELVGKAVAKAESASASAASLSIKFENALTLLTSVQTEHDNLTTTTLPSLEKELTRERAKATKSTDIAKGFSKQLIEERKVSEGLMKRIEFLEAGMEKAKMEIEEVKKREEEGRMREEELKEENRDLMFALSAGEKLKAMEGSGEVEEGEVEGGSVGVVEKTGRRRKK